MNPTGSSQRRNETPSVKLEGEKRSLPNCELGRVKRVRGRRSCRTRYKTCTNGWKGGRRSAHRGELQTSRTTQAMKRPYQALPQWLECPRVNQDEAGDGRNAPHQVRWPGYHKDEQERDVQVDRKCRNVADGTRIDGTRPSTKEYVRVVESKARRRDFGPGGHKGERVGLGSVEDDWRRRNDGDGIGYDGKRCWMDGATSGARCGSIRVRMRLLVFRENAHQHKRYKRTRYLGHLHHLPITPVTHRLF